MKNSRRAAKYDAIASRNEKHKARMRNTLSGFGVEADGSPTLPALYEMAHSSKKTVTTLTLLVATALSSGCGKAAFVVDCGCNQTPSNPQPNPPTPTCTYASVWGTANSNPTKANLQSVLTTCKLPGQPILYTGNIQQYGRGDGNTLPGYVFAYYNNNGTQQLYLYRIQAYLNQLGQTIDVDGYPCAKVDGVAVTSSGVNLTAFDQIHDGAVYTFPPSMPKLIPSPDFLQIAQSLFSQAGGTFNYAPANGETAAIQLSDVTLSYEQSQRATATLNSTLNSLSGTSYFTATKWIDYSTRDNVNTPDGVYWTMDPGTYATGTTIGTPSDPYIEGTGTVYQVTVSGTHREYFAFDNIGNGYLDFVKTLSYTIGQPVAAASASAVTAAKGLADAVGLPNFTNGTTLTAAVVSAQVEANIDPMQTESAATANAIEELNQFAGESAGKIVIDSKPVEAAPVQNATPAADAPGPISMSVTPRLTLKGAANGSSKIVTIDKDGISGSEMTLSKDGGSVVRLFGTVFEEEKFNRMNATVNAANKSGGVPKAGFSTASRFDFAT